ncbi:class F sortase, partial [Streptomyces sp. 150FB]|uniref:class F sortase n=1 Tax=Streptomyces sp. 150FB TaxID=1576605 RepID=UPI001F268A0B
RTRGRRRHGPPRPARRSRIAALAALTAGMALTVTGTCALLGYGNHPPGAVDLGDLPLVQGTAGHPTAASAAPPTRIRIPGVGLDLPLTRLQVQQDGHLGAPEKPGQAGWWSGGPRPGAPGAAIIVGHIDSRTGPGAFHAIPSLRPGEEITIDRGDHSSVSFTVRALRQYGKDRFPDDQVYATGGPPVLRLITCGGSYDRGHGEYRDNIVLYATLTGPAPPHRTTPTANHPHRSGN